MTKEQLWKIYCYKNPQFNEPESRFSMTGSGLKKLFDQTYDIAHDKGFANGKSKAALDQKVSKSMEDIMPGLFGKK